MKKVLLIVSLALLASSSVMAKKRSLSEMRKAAATISVHQNGSRRSPSAPESQFEVVKEESQLTVLSNKARFAVIANDDNFDAVLGYSDTPFDESALSNPGLRWWMEAMNESLARHAEEGTRPRRVSINPNYKPNVEELLTTKWDQSEPYFNMTPTYVEGTREVHFVTGCVATAMAQIMKYYNYPEKGKGTKTYRCNMYASDGDPITKRISVNFAAATYDWNNMLDKYGKSYSAEAANAVALLMYHCGVSVTMDYDKTGSGAYNYKAIDALVTNFLYNENMHYYVRDYYHVDEWMDIIFSQLSQGHPILYGGQSNSGGHAFVVDGYSTAGLVHVNWGWSGSSDGYFDVASLKGYSSWQSMSPVFLPTELVPRFSSFGFPEEPFYKVHMGNISANAPYVINTDYREFKGSIALVAAPLGGGENVVLSKQEANVSGYGFDMLLHWASTAFSVNPATLADGKYRLYMASMGQGDAEWQPVRSKENISNSAILTISNGQASLVKEKDSNWTVAVNPIAAPSRQSETFSLSGYKVSDDFSKLPQGVYIQNGRKILKK